MDEDAPSVTLGEVGGFVAAERLELAGEDERETGKAVRLAFGDVL